MATYFFQVTRHEHEPTKRNVRLRTWSGPPQESKVGAEVRRRSPGVRLRCVSAVDELVACVCVCV